MHKPVKNRLESNPYVSRFLEANVDDWKVRRGDYAVPVMSYNAIHRNISKYNGATVLPSKADQALMEEAIDMVVGMWSSISSATRIMTLDEVISATHDTIGSSPGAPWCASYSSHADVLAEHKGWVQQYIDDAYAGHFHRAAWWAFPKEELRTAEKVALGKVRHISGCSTEFKFLSNTLLLSQNEAFYTLHAQPDAWTKVGMSAEYGGWTRLGQELAKHPNGVEADISQMDADFSWYMAQQVMSVRQRLWPEAMRTPANIALLGHIYDQVWRGMQYTPDGYVYRKEHGNSSGSPNTVVDNTIATCLAIAFSLLRARLGNPGSDAPSVDEAREEIHNNFSIAAYGDDNTTTYSDAVPWFTAEVLRDGFQRLGWRLTFAGEVGGHVSPLRMHDLSFLSRKFVEHKAYHRIWYVPEFVDPWKFVCSLEQKSRKSESLMQTLQRAVGLYHVAFWSPPVRTVLRGMIDNLRSKLAAGTAAERLAARNVPTEDREIQLYLGVGPAYDHKTYSAIINAVRDEFLA